MIIMRKRVRISSIVALLFLLAAAVTAQQQAGYELRRYVDVKNGAYANDGRSWDKARNNLQDAINELAEYMATNGITEGGEIFVAEGTYSPTESTEGGSTLFSSFKMSPGIALYGGFPAGGKEDGGEYIEDPAHRPMREGHRYGWQFKYETILSGDLLGSNPATFEWSDENQSYTTTFPSNVYHVVWFAVKGFDSDGTPVALDHEAVLDGFTVKHGYASDETSSGVHYSRGGGIYLVEGGVVRNCIVTENSATERGGGVYLDGGGLVESSYLHRNTSPGAAGSSEGYGGAAALSGGGDIRYSMIVNNFAANGGGLALYNPTGSTGTLADYLNMSAVSTIIANNTASNEAGGVYLHNGGILNNLTVVANRCNGTGITINDVQNGKSAGVYVKNYGCIINSVFWGGTVGTTGFVQYYHRPDADKTSAITSLVFYSAFSDQAITEWTYTYRSSVLSLERENTASVSEADNYPVFTHPPLDADGRLARAGVLSEADNYTGDDDYATRYDWQPAPVSPMREYGRRISDLKELSTYPLDRAATTTDICGDSYNICPSLGAYHIGSPEITPYESDDTVALFVDPEVNSMAEGGLGGSWETPLAYLNVALEHFRNNLYDGKKRIIYVKEGTVSPLCSYFSDRYLSAGIQLVSGVEVYGGYARSLAGTDRSLRNPVVYRSVIDGKVGDKEFVYHCVVFKEVSDAVLDGFHIINGDATQTGNQSSLIKHGGGIVMVVDPQMGAVAGGTMTGNVIRNCIIENCVGERGAALYAAPREGADFSLTMSNCVINNNTSTYSDAAPSAAVYFDMPGAAGNVSVNMDHQTIVKNVGYGVYATLPGKVSLIDSWVWSNARFDLSDCTQLKAEDALTIENVSATYCAFDTGAGFDADGNFSTLTYNKNEANYPVCENPTRNIGRSLDAFNTYNGGLTSYMPSNMSPLINRACPDADHTLTDITTVTLRTTGGGPDIGAYQNSKLPLKGRVFYVRDYRDAEGKVDLSRGGDGSSWAEAINGNAIYDMETGGAVIENNRKISTTDSRYTGYYDADACPYGETSNASKQFWATNPKCIITNIQYDRTENRGWGIYDHYYTYTYTYTWNNGANGPDDYEGTGTHRERITFGNDTPPDITESDINPPSAPLYVHQITNTREEQYVGGLQYAVEMASRAARDSMRRLEVWVAGGTYTDYKGFVIRDSVTVKGGFPDVDTGCPGESERRPLLAKGIPLNDENSGYADRIADYETILQIQAEAPVTVTDAVNGGYTVSGNLLPNIRKYVLSQPDVCLPTKAPVSDDFYHGGTNRDNDSENPKSDEQRDDFIQYEGNPVWDGFTIRHGFITLSSNRDGGAGVRLFYGASIQNCVVRNNVHQASRARGGGIYCDNPDGFVSNCFVVDNVAEGNNDPYGGGIYMIQGTAYNILVANNYAKLDGGGIFLENAVFYNNTVAYNGCGRNGGGMSQWSKGSSSGGLNLEVFNCLFYGNSGRAIHSSAPSYFNGIKNSFVQTKERSDEGVYNKIINENTNIYGEGTSLKSPFEVSNPQKDNNFRLSASSVCINAGLNEPEGISLPLTDIDFADRIQDCTIDIGAYEHNGAYDINPRLEEVNIGGQDVDAYIYYVTYAGGEGNASADSPENAACWMKLQKVLDAAGRAKAANPHLHYIVKVAGSTTAYAPRRTAVVPGEDQMLDDEIDVRSYALIVPRGVEVWGGYDETFVERDIRTHKTTFKAQYVSAADTSLINTYHAVVFTEYLYDENGDLIREGEGETYNYKTIPASAGYAVLDGLFITGGNADGSLHEDDSRGGGVIAEPYSHIRNCIVQDNAASGEGGGVYLKAGAIVSGTLVTGNSADMGAGIYAEGDTGDEDSYVIASTIVRNAAAGEGGGIYFTGRRLNVNSSVVWGNTANYAKDVYGNYNGGDKNDYLFSYVAVENLQVPGLNNRSVSADNESGVRFVDDGNGGYGYYMIQETSVLVAAGMPQREYDRWLSAVQLATHDFAGRVRNMGDNIDVGARSLGVSIAPPEDLLIRRIFVTDGTRVHSDLDKLLDTPLTGNDTIYQVRGASFVYPMYELHDALRYIKHIRNKKEPLVDGVDNKDLLFEIFMAGGTYTPREASDGTTVENARTSAFTIPEGVSIYGGFSGKELYCQDTDGGTHEIAGIGFVPALSDTCLSRRERMDLNGNSVVEPWEFSNQTVFSGKSNSEINAHGVYHVIYACADENKVGTLPELVSVGNSGTKSGQPIILDGITVTGGYAADLVPGDDAYRDNYYKGGAVCVDGTDNGGAGGTKRYIPLTIRRSLIYGNSGVQGGAIYNTGICSIFSSQISANEAVASSASDEGGEYAGSGGALYVDGAVYSVNSLYANNEAAGKGGAIFNESNSRIWVVNCNLVRNKAAEYPCIYSLNKSAIGMEAINLSSNLVFNTAFWGNESASGCYTINKWNTDGSPCGDPSTADAPDILYFCAYEEGWDKIAVMGEGNKDASAVGIIPNFKNNNVNLTSENRSLYGPNFSNPSIRAGVAGYQQSTDWSLSRINPMVDAGWGWAVQTYDETSDSWLWASPSDEDKKRGGLYFALSHYIALGNITVYGKLLPGVGDTYMKTAAGRELHRVSLDLNKSKGESGQNTYIDIGVYEYEHTLLNTDADTLYVCAEEMPGSTNDGSSWATATSNLQRAIERLTLNRNGKDKVIFMTEGEYAPIYTVNKNGGFVIDTRYGSGDDKSTGTKNIGSIRIAGGYNDDNQRQPIPVESSIYRGEAYKTIVTTINSGVKTLFNIEDAANRENDDTGEESAKPVIPVTIENITFENPYGTAFRYETKAGTDDKNITKLTLSGCEFRGNDGTAVSLPVVKIAGRGGRSLIYNTLFHSNKGVPLDAVDTEVFNATFAMNTGVPVLSDSIYGENAYSSKLYNSVLWRNGGMGIDKNGSENISGSQLGGTPATGCDIINSENIRYNAVQNLAATTLALPEYNNDDLVPQNDDVIRGPNFENPYADDLAVRSFDIGASAVLLNKGDSASYRAALGIADGQSSGYDITLSDLRVYDENIDRGAYENNQRLYPVLYVQPGKTLDGDGTTWEKAFGQGRLQEAVDLCAVYVATRKDGGDATVFVKGGRTGESVTMRNGVSLYGSVQSSYTDTVTASGVEPVVTVDKIAADRPGLLASTTISTEIEGVSYNGEEDFENVVLLDGFEIVSATEKTTAAVRVSDKMALRNNYVHGMTVTGGNVPVVENTGGLLYNMLIEGNTPGEGAAVVKNDGGTLVNLTVDAPEGTTPVVSINEGKMFNTIVTKNRMLDDTLYEDEALKNDNDPYNPYLEGPLSYQLKEMSAAIDKGEANSFVLNTFARYIDYDTDRDVMGNARLFADQVDYGCFETWNIEDGYKATQAPAGGSVVYVHSGNLELAGLSSTFAPGYLLLKEGASLYANGNAVSLDYVAVERKYDNAGWQLAAVPYALQRAGIERVAYEGTTYAPRSLAEDDTTAYYDGRGRAESLTKYAESNSDFWKVKDSFAAGEGFGLRLSEAGTYRFTGRGTAVYTENNTDKTVSLTQHNLTEVEEDGSPRFTHKENMGWNLFGIPYLVASYDLNGIDLPHLLYSYDGQTYNTAESWESGTGSMGDGFFTQTAVIGNGSVEELIFPQPRVPEVNAYASSRQNLALRISGETGSDEVALRTQESSAGALAYEIGRDGIKFMSMNRDVPQIYIANPSTGTRFSLAAAVDETALTPIGVYVADSGMYTIDLPDGTIAEDYDVILLTDNATGQITDLKESAYTFASDGAGDEFGRFSLAFRHNEVLESTVQVYVYERTLYVKGLEGGERIRMFDTSGTCRLDAVGEGEQYTALVDKEGVYIVDIVSSGVRKSYKVAVY